MASFSRRFAITAGGTRIVFLLGDYVVKVPRIKLLAWLPIVVERLRRQDPLRYETRRPGRMSLVGACGHLLEIIFLAGFLSNLRESRRWLRKASPELAPTIFSLPLGILNVQLRAATDSAEIGRDVPISLISASNLFDVCLSNFGVINGQTVWLDYGGYHHPCDIRGMQFRRFANLPSRGASE